MLLKQMQSVSLDFSPIIQLSTRALEINVYVACLYIKVFYIYTYNVKKHEQLRNSLVPEVNTDGRLTVCTEASGQKHKMSKTH